MLSSLLYFVLFLTCSLFYTYRVWQSFLILYFISPGQKRNYIASGFHATLGTGFERES